MTTSRSVLLSLLYFLLFLQISKSSSTSSKPYNNTLLLQDVLKEIAANQKLDLDGVRILNLDVSKVKFGIAERYEIRFGFGKTRLVAKFSDEVASWNKPSKDETDLGSLINEVGAMAVISSFKVDGPFELRIEGEADRLSLMLPINITHSGLKRIVVGQGITLEVSRAREVSVYHPYDLGKLLNQITTRTQVERGQFFQAPSHSSCTPLIPIRVSGSAEINAYRTGNPHSFIRTTYVSKNAIELLPDKCCHNNRRSVMAASPVDSLNLRLNLLKNGLKHVLGDRNRMIQSSFPGFVKGVMKALPVIQFQLELERNGGSNDSVHSTLAEWRTRPRVEHVWFEVLARIEEEKLIPLSVKKKPFNVVADSAAWSNLMSNMSFTMFPSLLVPPEALTLDIKW